MIHSPIQRATCYFYLSYNSYCIKNITIFSLRKIKLIVEYSLFFKSSIHLLMSRHQPIHFVSLQSWNIILGNTWCIWSFVPAVCQIEFPVWDHEMQFASCYLKIRPNSTQEWAINRYYPTS